MKLKGIFAILFSMVFLLLFSISVSAETNQSLELGKKVTGEITEVVKSETYEIQIGKPSLVSIELSSYIYDMKISFLDSNGKQITNNYVSYGSPANPQKWFKEEYLEAGTYYIKVDKTGNYTGKYEIEVHAEATNNNEPEPNNGTVEAAPLTFDQQVTGLISWNDDLDTYKVTLDEPGKLSIDFSSYMYDTRLSLEDDKGQEIKGSYIYSGSATDPKKWSYSEYLEAGTYYIKIKKSSNYTGKYDIKVRFMATKNYELEPNNGTVQAQLLSLNEKVKGLISWNDGQDTYKIELKNPGEIAFHLDSYIYDTKITVQSSNGENLFSSYVYSGSETDPKKWTKTVELEKGIYYIHITKSSNYTGKYDFWVSNVVRLKDVIEGEYYYDSVINLVTKGIISGYQDGTFRPHQDLTRAHAIVLLKNALNLEVPDNYQEIAAKFSDVGKDYMYAKEVAAVYQAGIFIGSNGKMDVKGKLTREQMATTIVRAFGLKDDPSKNGLNGVVDSKSISPSHKKNVEIFYETGITTGKADGTYAPKESVTRGQFATFLDRVLNQNK